jgi:hypothetical protein
VSQSRAAARRRQDLNEGIKLYAQMGGVKLKKGECLNPFNIFQKSAHYRKISLPMTEPVPSLLGLALAQVQNSGQALSGWLPHPPWSGVNVERADATLKLFCDPSSATAEDVSILIHGEIVSEERLAAARETAARAHPETAARRREVATHDEMLAAYMNM